MDGPTETLRDMLRRLAEPGFSVDISVTDTPTDKLRRMLKEMNPLGAFDEEMRRKADEIADELVRRGSLQ